MAAVNRPGPRVRAHGVDDILRHHETQDSSGKRVLSALVAGKAAVQRGFLLIGTAESQAVHEPTTNQLYFDLNLGRWVMRREPEGPPIVRASRLARPALLCALCGDYNVPGQRKLMGQALTDDPPPHFGWTADRNSDERVRIHARPTVIAAIQELGGRLVGKIDIVMATSLFIHEQADVGQFTFESPLVTVGTLTVTGNDLPADVRPIDYDLTDSLLEFGRRPEEEPHDDR
jgi:hypothetical protein